MNLLEKAKIITTATAYDDGKLHSVKGGTNADFDVVRGSLATRVNAEGLIEEVATNIPRIDYSTGEGVILTEPQSTNLIPYSEDFSQWIEARAAYTNETQQSIISGKSIVNKLTDTAVNNAHIVYIDPLLPSGGFEYTFSSFLKKGSLNFGFLAFANSDVSTCIFNLDLGTIHSQGADLQGAKIEDYGNGWYKCSVTFTEDLSGKLLRIGTSDGNRIYTGSGTGYIYFDAAQLEQSSFATSYIPTNGAIATRLADSITGAGSTDLINSEEGVLYVETSALADNDNGYIGLFGGSNSRVRIVFTNQIKAQLFNGSYQCNIGFTQSQTNNNKIAFKYKENDFALWINGVEVGTDTSGVTFSANTLSYLNLGSYNGASNLVKGKTKCIAVFSEALTDEELTCLTTI